MEWWSDGTDGPAMRALPSRERSASRIQDTCSANGGRILNLLNGASIPFKIRDASPLPGARTCAAPRTRPRTPQYVSTERLHPARALTAQDVSPSSSPSLLHPFPHFALAIATRTRSPLHSASPVNLRLAIFDQ